MTLQSKVNDWDYHKKQFIKLGGTVNNLDCREGKNGRGIFRQGNKLKPKIICPPQLLTKIEDIVLVKGEFRLRKDSTYSAEAREFIESYYDKLSWGSSGKREATKFLTEITQIPLDAKKFLLAKKICSKKLLYGKVNLTAVFEQFWNSRTVKFNKTPVLAPIWELVNHSPFAHSFRKTQYGVETPNYRADITTDEIFHSYKKGSSPINIFFSYGFASNEIFAYSFPILIELNDRKLTIEVEGRQKAIESDSDQIKMGENLLLIPSLPVGSISRILPKLYLDSIMAKYQIEEKCTIDLLNFIQHKNIQQRNELKALLKAGLSDTTKLLIESIDFEINLIKKTLDQA